MFLLLFAACTPPTGMKPPPEEDTGCDQRWYRDTDADGFGDPARGEAGGCEPPEGYVAEAGDCDDLDPELHPGAAERCDNVDQDCDGAFDEDPIDAPGWHPDTDADGFGNAEFTVVACEAPGTHVADASDCDDTDPAVFPGAVELCNDADDDCDGTVDDDPVDGPTWYVDTDGDGWGDAESDTASCTQPAGTSTADGDCDDTDPLVAPDMPERCNGADDDCDRIADAGSVDAPTGYRDADGDGYGDPTIDITLCSLPAGYVLDATDCDDADAGVHPDATEVCGGIDEDCDGAVDEDGAAPAPWYADADGDGFGDATAVATECFAPTGYVADATDCDDTMAAIAPTATEVCNTVDDDCDGDTDEGGGAPPTWYADADGDSYGDPTSTTVACTSPPAHVADATDCDDTNAAANPSATEVCNAADDNCDGVTDTDAVDRPTWYADLDADGFGDAATSTLACDAPLAYVSDATDCDDRSDAVNPLAPELCNTVDDNCDGVTDTDAVDQPTWYADTDGDGFGDAAVTSVTCYVPAAHVADATDCDDADVTVFPGADEWCNSLDDDCDGTTDEDDALDATTWYRDADIDGRGDPTTTLTSCTRSYGYVTDSSDCDDTNASVHPSMTEFCATDYDDNCDGTAQLVGAVDCTQWYVDADGDGSGVSGATQCQCIAGSGYDAPNDDDCDDADPQAYGGASELWGDGVDQSCEGDGDATDLADEAVLIYGTARDDYAGADVAGGDLDGDGLSELLVAAPYVNDRSTDAGAVYVFAAPTEDVSVTAALTTVSGLTYQERLGFSVTAGDFDGDGLDDVVAGSYTSTTVSYAYVFYAGVSGDTSATAEASIDNSSRETSVYRADAVGDLDGDGPEELILQSGQTTSSTMLFRAPLGALTSADAEVTLTAVGGTSPATTAASAGDLDGDGAGDLVLGIPSMRTAGVAVGGITVYYGMPTSGELEAMADVTLRGTAAGGLAGTSVASAGDVDGDGLDDLLVGAPSATGGAGRAYLLTALDIANLSSAYTVFTGSLSARFGLSVAAGDFDTDGTPDLAVAEPYHSSNAGAVHLFVDFSSGTVSSTAADVTFVGNPSSYAGSVLHALGDADGDGIDDLLIGADREATGAVAGGGAWFVRGR